MDAIREIRIVIKEDDGMAWMEDGVLYLNARWLTNFPEDIDEVIDEIVTSTVHEIVEHLFDLGHDVAVRSETYVSKRVIHMEQCNTHG